MVQQKVGVKLFLDDDDYKKELKQSDKDSKTWAQGVSGSINKIVSVGQGLFFTINGFSQAFNLLKDAMNVPIDKASEFVEILGKATVVFGDNIDDVREWAQAFGNAETGVGRSEASLLSMLSTLQDTFVPMGFARKEASELAKTMTALAVDVASFNNEMDEDVIRDFQSTLVGNHETVRKYGIVITEATLKQEALDSGLIKLGEKLTNEAKIRARLNLIIQGTADAQGDAMRTAESDANTRKRRNAILDDTFKILGDKLLPANTAWLNIQIDLVKTFKDYISIPVADKMREEQIATNTLVNRITSLVEGTDKRNELVKELQKDYPDFLENIDAETTSNEDLTKALKTYNEQLLIKIQLQVLDEERNEVLAEQTKAIQAEVRAEIELSKAIATARVNNQEELEALGFTLDTTKSLVEQADILGDVYGDLLRNSPFSPKLSKEVQKLETASLDLVNAQEKRVKVEKRVNDELKIFEETRKRIAGGLLDVPDAPDAPIVNGLTVEELKQFNEKQKLADLEFFEWKEAQELERSENIKKIKADEEKFKRRQALETDQTDKKLLENRKSREEEYFENMIGLAVDLGDAFVRGFDSEGLRGALKETLLLLLSFYEKRLLLEKFEAGAKAIGGDPRALAELGFITLGFEGIKASIRNFADGAVVKATNGGLVGRVAEDGHDELISPLDGPSSPFPVILQALKKLVEQSNNNEVVLLNSVIKGEDLKIIIDKQERKLL